MTMIEYRNILYLSEDARLSEEEREQVDRILSLWKYAPTFARTNFTSPLSITAARWYEPPSWSAKPSSS